MIVTRLSKFEYKNVFITCRPNGFDVQTWVIFPNEGKAIGYDTTGRSYPMKVHEEFMHEIIDGYIDVILPTDVDQTYYRMTNDISVISPFKIVRDVE